ncbi:MAG: hypothetical protein RLZ44_1356 [Pseudomonadota bacterium]
MNARPQLLFVYNADSGLFNTLADIGHKIFAPQTYACQLCALTYGYFTERAAWREFVETLPAACEFLHRDQFRARYPGSDTALPAVFRLADDGPNVCIDASTLGACDSLAALQRLIRQRCVR